MSNDLYRFTVIDGTVTAMSELDSGVWQPDPIESNEALVFDPATLSVTLTETRDGFLEVKTFSVVDGTADYTLTGEVYTDLLGNPITSQPGEMNDEDHDGFDDDDIDHDGFEDDHLSGDDSNDDINGEAGDDSMDGAGGDDSMVGGLGDDSMHGGQGADDLAGSEGNDKLSGDDGADHIAGGQGSDDLIGGNGWDDLLGGGGADSLSGGNGNDDILGGDGNDTIDGGHDAGDDDYGGGAGFDTVSYSGAAGGVSVNLGTGTGASMGTTDVAHVGHDHLVSIERVSGSGFDDRLVGNGANNTLGGGSGDDTLNGSSGSDVIAGGSGDDKLYGGNDSVSDTFDFNSITESRSGSHHDLVFNFKTGIDRIDLGTIDADTTVAGNQAFTFGGTTATDHGVWTAQSGSNLFVYADVNGDHVADLTIELAGVSSIAAPDFLL